MRYQRSFYRIVRSLLLINEEEVEKVIIKKNTILKAAWLIYFIIVLNYNNFPGMQLISLVTMVLLTVICASEKLKSSNFYTGKWYLIFFLYMTLSFLWAVFKDRSSGVYEASFRVLLFVLCLDVFCDSKENTDYMLNAAIFAGVFYAIHVIMTTPVSYYGTVNVGASVNEQRNFVGQVCALISIISFVLLMSEKQRKKRSWYLFAMILCYFVSCISGSRKAFLMLPLAVVLYLLTQKSLNKKLQYLLILFIVAILFFSIFAQSAYLQEYFGERLLAIFDDSIADKSIAGRNYLKLVAISLFQKHPILGMGCDNVRSYLRSIGYPNQVYAHNNYLELLADYGIVGIVLFYNFHLRVLYQTIKDRWSNMYSKMSFVFILAIMFMDYGQVSYQKHMYIYLLVVVCSSIKWSKKIE